MWLSLLACTSRNKRCQPFFGISPFPQSPRGPLSTLPHLGHHMDTYPRPSHAAMAIHVDDYISATPSLCQTALIFSCKSTTSHHLLALPCGVPHSLLDDHHCMITDVPATVSIVVAAPNQRIRISSRRQPSMPPVDSRQQTVHPLQAHFKSLTHTQRHRAILFVSHEFFS